MNQRTSVPAYSFLSALTKVEGDSIIRFATKVDTYVTHYPETKSDPYYPEIVDNINEAAKNCGLSLHINLNPDWEGVEDITIGYIKSIF